ncbi:hypothetical protein M8494_08895 [Serratia ureilytica]
MPQTGREPAGRRQRRHRRGHRDRHALPAGREEKSGLLGSGGIGFTIGEQSSKHEIDEKGRTQSQRRTVGSSGSVNVTAGNQHIGGADLWRPRIWLYRRQRDYRSRR